MKEEPKSTRIRERLHITLSPESREWVKNNSVNASRLIDSLIVAAKNSVEPAYVLISAKEERPGRDLNASRRRDRPQFENERIRIAEIENAPQFSEEKSDEKETFKSLFKRYQKEYATYLQRVKNNTPDTIKDELNTLSKYPDFATPDQYLKLKPPNSWQARGLRKFLNFLDDVKGIEEPLGTRTARWLKLIKIPAAKARRKRATDDDVIEGYRLVLPQYRTFYKLKALSGARTEHLYEMLKEFDSSKVIVEGEIARYPTEHLAKGTKLTYFVFFPAYLLPEVEKYQLPRGRFGPVVSVDAITSALRVGRVDSNILRAWFFNLCTSQEYADSISDRVTDFIQGRAPRNVSDRFYRDAELQSVAGLNRIVHRFPKFPDLPTEQDTTKFKSSTSFQKTVWQPPPAKDTELLHILRRHREAYEAAAAPRYVSPLRTVMETQGHQIKRPQDFDSLKLSNNAKVAFRMFIKFLADSQGMTEILGHSPEEWLKHIKLKKS